MGANGSWVLALVLVALLGAGPAAARPSPDPAGAGLRVGVLDAPAGGDLAAPDWRDRVGALAASGARLVVLRGWLGSADAPLSLETDILPALRPLAGEGRPDFAFAYFERADDGGYYRSTAIADGQGALLQFRQQIVPPAENDGRIRRGDFRRMVEPAGIGDLRVAALPAADLLTTTPRNSDRATDLALVFATDSAPWTPERIRQAAELATRFGTRLALVGAADQAGGTALHVLDAASGTPVGLKAGETVSVGVVAARVVEAPLGLPRRVPFPNLAPPSADIAALGERLFFDVEISENRSSSCASCHAPDLAYTNGEALARIGAAEPTKRNVPTLLNVAYRRLLRSDGYASSIENFIKYPVSGHNELNLYYLDALIERINADPFYVAAFAGAFGQREIEFWMIERSLATYLRFLVSGNSRFDRYWFAGEEGALDDPEKRGLGVFLGKGRCAVCHEMGRQAALFTDFGFHNLGIGWEARNGEYRDLGLGGISSNDFAGYFQTPSLRDVSRTPPYMHDGSLATLEDVVDFYNGGGFHDAPDKSPILAPLHLSQREVDDLVSFLRTLEGEPAPRPWRTTGAETRRYAGSEAEPQ